MRDLLHLAEANYRHLCYCDESRFCLVSNVPRAWQAPGEPLIALPATRGPGLNVAGFLRHDGTDFHAYATTGSLVSQDVMLFFNDFCPQLTRPVVRDNASSHRPAAFKARIPEWESQGLTLLYLPPYSPEVNRVEILWRCCKHQWLNPRAYRSFADLTHELRMMLN